MPVFLFSSLGCADSHSFVLPFSTQSWQNTVKTVRSTVCWTLAPHDSVGHLRILQSYFNFLASSVGGRDLIMPTLEPESMRIEHTFG